MAARFLKYHPYSDFVAACRAVLRYNMLRISIGIENSDDSLEENQKAYDALN